MGFSFEEEGRPSPQPSLGLLQLQRSAPLLVDCKSVGVKIPGYHELAADTGADQFSPSWVFAIRSYFSQLESGVCFPGLGLLGPGRGQKRSVVPFLGCSDFCMQQGLGLLVCNRFESVI